VWSILSLLTFPFGPFTRYRIISAWSRIVIWLARNAVRHPVRSSRMQNLPERPSIVLAKHQSAWETLAFQVFSAAGVGDQARVAQGPVLRWGLAMTNPIAIDRSAGRQALKQMVEEGATASRRAFWIVIFPKAIASAGSKGEYHIGGAGSPPGPAHGGSGRAQLGYLWRRDAFVKLPGTITVSIGPALDPRHEGRRVEPESGRLDRERSSAHRSATLQLGLFGEPATLAQARSSRWPAADRVHLKRSARRRRIVLTVDETGLTVHVPWRTGERQIAEVIAQSQSWIARQLAPGRTRSAPRAWTHGTNSTSSAVSCRSRWFSARACAGAPARRRGAGGRTASNDERNGFARPS